MVNGNVLLEMRGITKDFPGVRALDNVNFSLYEGEVHCLLGENGAGKSTLIKILTGVHSPNAGEIIFDGKVIHHLTPRYAQQLGISAIYQEFQLAPTLTIAENVFLGREPRNLFGKINHEVIRQRTLDLFHQLDFEVDPDWLVSDIGVGLRQMTEVVKVLARGGRVVIMDEPTTSLNEVEVERLFATVKRMKEQGIAIIYISHRMEEIFQIGDRVTVLRDGKLVGTVELAKVTSAEIVSMMVGRTMKEKFYKEQVPIGDILWRGENIWDENGMVKGVSFFVRSGEILGLAGIRGSGFKELARLIGGVEKISQGGFFDKNGQVRSIHSPQDAIKAGVGYLPDDRKGEGLVLLLSLRSNLVLPILPWLSRRGWVDDRKASLVAQNYIRDLNIQTPSMERPVEFLSGGNQQKVVLAKWLASNAKLLVLDAPTQGIDIGAKVEMYKLIARHVREGGAVILVSSELPELLAIADRIMVMREGRVVGEFISNETSEEEVLHLAAAGDVVYGKN